MLIIIQKAVAGLRRINLDGLRWRVLGSTGEHDRKRRHFSSISSPTAAAPKKQPFLPISEDKKVKPAFLWIGVLVYVHVLRDCCDDFWYVRHN